MSSGGISSGGGPAGGAPVGEPPVERAGEAMRARVAVESPNGLHLRPSTAFARIAAASGCRVSVVCGPREVNGASVIELAMLAATQGTDLEIVVRGPAREAADTLRQLVEVVASRKTV